MIALVLAASACGESPLTSGATDSSTTTRTEDPATTTATPTTTSTSSASSTSASPGGPLGTEAEGRPLTLADFFMPDSYWEEKRFDIADQKDVLGLGVEISCSTTAELELRLANNFDTLDFSVGQANDSVSSEESVSVEVLANSAQVEIRSVPFNQVQSFTIPVTGVNALKISVTADRDTSSCDNYATAVITGARLS
jgi:hypothetical protein